MTDHRAVRGYDRLARHYRLLESLLFGALLQQARKRMLERLPPLQNVLILGDGDGRFLHDFCLAQPQCKITSVDHSREMLRLQDERSRNADASDRVELILADARAFQPDRGHFDCLATLFFLDCFDQADLNRAFPRWLAAVRPGGFFLMVDFQQPAHGWRRLRATVYLNLMHCFFRWQTRLPNRKLVDIDTVLRDQPISPVSINTSSCDLITERLYRVDPVSGANDFP